jgi:sigma-B regulation protein RsbU (phosphoserine phosphatase)
MNKFKSLFQAFLGLIFLAVFFWLFSHSRINRLIQLRVPKSEILARAEQAFKASPVGKYHLTKKVNVDLNEDLTYYAQSLLQKDGANAFLPIGSWEVAWRGKVQNAEDEKQQKASFAVSYDFQGNLIGLRQELSEKAKPSNLHEPAALALAKGFLATQNVDTSALKLTTRKTSQENDLLRYNFAFTVPSFFPKLQQTHEVEISASEVTRYDAKLTFEDGELKKPKLEEVSDIVAISLAFVTWLAVSVVLLVVFFKRFRHDELEFKGALWLGIGAFVVIWGLVAIQSWPEWAGVLLGGGFAGLFVGGGLLLAYAAAESLTREVWQEKLAIIDVWLRGYLRFKEMGTAILTSFFLAGLALLALGGLIWLTGNMDWGYFKIDQGNLWTLGDFEAAASGISGLLIKTGFVFVLLLGFGASYVRSKIETPATAIVVLGVLLNLSGLHFIFLRPTYLALMLMLPLAMLWAYFAYKYDLFTVLLSLVGFYYFLDFGFIVILPEGFFGTPAVVTGVVTSVMLIAGLVLMQSPKSATDFGDYTPEYVSRIAEHERFLKELEIARNVQMQLLPQANPSFSSLEIASICRPAREVGGDYYDFIPEGSECLSIVIGDVSGKGVSAAFYMTMVKGIIKTLSKKTQSPKLLLSELNEIFFESTPKEIFISAIYGRFDMQNRTLTFARAGHNPLIVTKSLGGEPQLLNPRGIAIGLERGKIFAATIEEKSMAVEPGDLFVFYTDGISESMNSKGEEFGEDRLRQLVSQHASVSAQALLDIIIRDVNEFSANTSQHDDFTLVVVKVR